MSAGDCIVYVDEDSKESATFKLDEVLGEGAFGVVFRASLVRCDASLKFPDGVAGK